MDDKKILCSDNIDFSKSPDDMINTDGTKNYAYVTLIMLGDSYVAGAIILAETIKRLGSMSELVVLITNDVSQEAIIILKRFYDKVINIEYINIQKIKKDDLSYSDVCFTKLNALNLIQYKKILLIDADTIILKYPDHLFTLNTPAGVYLEENDNKKEYKIDKIDLKKEISIFKKNCKFHLHGKVVNNKNIKISKKILLLEPNKKQFDEMIRDIKTIKDSSIYTEHEYLEKIYVGLWTSIEPIFLGLNGLPHWSILYGLHYGKEKPFILESEIPVETRASFESFQLWYKFYRDITNRYSDLLSSKILSDANTMSIYYINDLCRRGSIFKSGLRTGFLASIKSVFNIKNPIYYYYYHINISKEYDNESINYLFEDDFIPNMINGIIKITKSKYWNDIKNRINTNQKLIKNEISNKINNEILNKLDKIDYENVLSYYIKINQNVCIILNIEKNNKENTQNFWLDNNMISNVIYKKNILLSGDTLKNILFNIMQTYSYNERIIKLDELFSDVNEYTITILIYKTIIDCNLYGNNKNIFIFSDTNTKLRACSILLNPNTMDKFKNKDIIFIPEKNKSFVIGQIYIKNMLIFQSIKKWIYNNYNGNLMDNIIIVNDFKLTNKLINKKYLLIDTNDYLKDQEDIYINFNKKKIEFIDIIFVNSNNIKSLNKYREIIDNIHDSRFYYQLDGIKFAL
jgi:hypothetical protein